jgi:hypothetical protein
LLTCDSSDGGDGLDFSLVHQQQLTFPLRLQQQRSPTPHLSLHQRHRRLQEVKPHVQHPLDTVLALELEQAIQSGLRTVSTGKA